MKRYIGAYKIELTVLTAWTAAALAAVAAIYWISADADVAQAQIADTPTPAPFISAAPDTFSPDAPSGRKPAAGRLDSYLSQLVEQAGGGAGYDAVSKALAIEAASAAPFHKEDAAGVAFHTEADGAAAVAAELGELANDDGIEVRHLFESYIEAYVPLNKLQAASELDGVLAVRPLLPPQPALGDIVSQGAAPHGAVLWHDAGFTGRGVKAAVIDRGFEGFASLMGSELPLNVKSMCFVETGIISYTPGLSACETGGDHGTNVAETLMDVAPGAELYIANPTSWGDLRTVVEWLASENVDVINHSIGWVWSGPGDGTSRYPSSPVNSVNYAVRGDIMVAVSAGNAGRGTWKGPFSDPNIDNRLNFTEFDESNAVELTAGERFVAQLRWADTWGYADTDLDLYLLDGGGRTVAGSYNIQSGGNAVSIPIEFINYTPSVSGVYYLIVELVAGEAPLWAQLQNFTDNRLQHYTVAGSMSSPGEGQNPGMLAVGAVNWRSPDVIAVYSGRGPTNDGRVKPDIMGFDCTASAGNERNCGTSFSSPHIAGMAALVRGRFPSMSAQQTAEYLEINEQARGDVPNNGWGYGLAQLPAPPAPTATPVITATPEGSPTATATAIPTRTPLDDEPLMSVGANHACGLYLDGAIRCWGNNDLGQATTPEEGRYTAIGSGRNHTCALREDGALVCWGAISGVFNKQAARR